MISIFIIILFIVILLLQIPLQILGIIETSLFFTTPLITMVLLLFFVAIRPNLDHAFRKKVGLLLGLGIGLWYTGMFPISRHNVLVSLYILVMVVLVIAYLTQLIQLASYPTIHPDTYTIKRATTINVAIFPIIMVGTIFSETFPLIVEIMSSILFLIPILYLARQLEGFTAELNEQDKADQQLLYPENTKN